MILIGYLSRVFAHRFFAVLLSLAALSQLMELLDASKRVFGAHGGAKTLLIYTALRLPLSVEKLVPLAVLIGAVLTFRRLVQENEATILRSAGLSGWRMLGALVPAALVLAVIQFSMTNWLAPAAERAFAEWWSTIAVPEEAEAPRTLWLRVGQSIISVEHADPDGRRLERVTEYRRDGEGRLTGMLRAAEARYGQDGWTLTDAQATELGRPFTTRAQMQWPDGPAVENVRELLNPTERISAAKARAILHGEWAGTASQFSIETKLVKIWRSPVLPPLMLLLATPALAGGRRTGGMARGTALGLGLGLGFMIVDGFFGSMSEAGSLPAPLAILAAPAIFAALGGWLMLQAEE